MNDKTIKEMFLRTIDIIDNYAKILYTHGEFGSINIVLPDGSIYNFRRRFDSSSLTLSKWYENKYTPIISLNQNTLSINDNDIIQILEDISNHILYLKLKDI